MDQFSDQSFSNTVPTMLELNVDGPKKSAFFRAMKCIIDQVAFTWMGSKLSYKSSGVLIQHIVRIAHRTYQCISNIFGAQKVWKSVSQTKWLILYA